MKGAGDEFRLGAEPEEADIHASVEPVYWVIASDDKET
jgi:hypothetical protein